MPATERRAYEARLAQLEASVERLGGALLATYGEDPDAARKLGERLEAAEIEIELIREALRSFDGAPLETESQFP